MRGHRAAIPLAAVVVIALALRMVGIDFGLPMLDHPDEPLLVSRADVMARTNDFNPHFFHYPSFLIYTLMVLFKFEYFLESLGVLDVSRSTLYLSSRVLVAVLGTAMILIVYLIGCKLYGKKIGILSAVFLAVMPMAVRDSHYATVDVPMTFLTTVAFFFIVSLAKSGRLRHGLIAGAFVGLAASTKQSGGLLLLPLFTAFVLAHVYHDPRLANLRSSSLAIARGFVCSSAGPRLDTSCHRLVEVCLDSLSRSSEPSRSRLAGRCGSIPSSCPELEEPQAGGGGGFLVVVVDTSLLSHHWLLGGEIREIRDSPSAFPGYHCLLCCCSKLGAVAGPSCQVVPHAGWCGFCCLVYHNSHCTGRSSAAIILACQRRSGEGNHAASGLGLDPREYPRRFAHSARDVHARNRVAGRV